MEIIIGAFDQAKLTAVADERYKMQNYAQKASQWQRGLRPDGILIGLCGEWAVREYLRGIGVPCAWNPSYIRGGDRGVDLMIGPVRIGVKTGYPAVRRFANGRLYKLDSDIYVFCYEPDMKASDGWHVKLRGWLSRMSFEREPFTESPRGTHWNIMIQPDHLEPMHRLKAFLSIWLPLDFLGLKCGSQI